jgi:hypothetical protein
MVVADGMAISALIRLALELPDWIVKVDRDNAREIARRSRAYRSTSAFTYSFHSLSRLALF